MIWGHQGGLLWHACMHSFIYSTAEILMQVTLEILSELSNSNQCVQIPVFQAYILRGSYFISKSLSFLISKMCTITPTLKKNHEIHSLFQQNLLDDALCLFLVLISYSIQHFFITRSTSTLTWQENHLKWNPSSGFESQF